jgi:hypothetical protein
MRAPTKDAARQATGGEVVQLSEYRRPKPVAPSMDGMPASNWEKLEWLGVEMQQGNFGADDLRDFARHLFNEFALDAGPHEHAVFEFMFGSVLTLNRVIGGRNA